MAASKRSKAAPKPSAGAGSSVPARVPGAVTPRPGASPADFSLESELLGISLRGGITEQLVEIGESARRESHLWNGYSPNLPSDVKDALAEWRTEASIRTGMYSALAETHVLALALSRMPVKDSGQIDEIAAAAEGREWLGSRRSAVRIPRNSAGSVLPMALTRKLRELRERTRNAKPKVEFHAILAAYVMDFVTSTPVPGDDSE
jgi:hypothetical protein